MSPNPIKALPWDSRFFGRSLARLSAKRLTPALARAVDQECARRRVQGLYFLAPSGDRATCAVAQAHGFQHVDTRVTLASKISLSSKVRNHIPKSVIFRTARTSDIPALKRMAKILFPSSRFAVDKHFPRGSHGRMFATWVAKSVRGRYDDWVGVAVIRSRLAGFISCRRTGRASGAIGLVGVSRPYQHMGIGRGLLHYAWTWFAKRHIRHVSVVTQADALQAQKFYRDGGFRTDRIERWYHKWY